MLYDLGLLDVGRPSWKVQALRRKNTSRDVLVEAAVLIATPGFSDANVWRIHRPIEYYTEGAVGILVWSYCHPRDERRAGVSLDALARGFQVPLKRITMWLWDGKFSKQRRTSY